MFKNVIYYTNGNLVDTDSTDHSSVEVMVIREATENKGFVVSSPNFGNSVVYDKNFYSAEYKYPSEVILGILSKALADTGAFNITFTADALDMINLICEGNRITF